MINLNRGKRKKSMLLSEKNDKDYSRLFILKCKPEDDGISFLIVFLPRGCNPSSIIRKHQASTS